MRLIEMRRVLKTTGSIYLHCDPTSSHYLKILMDAVFGSSNFRNEIIWGIASGARVLTSSCEITTSFSSTRKGRRIRSTS